LNEVNEMFGKFIKEADNYVMDEKNNVCTINSDINEFVAFNVIDDGKIIINAHEQGLLFTGITNGELKNLEMVLNVSQDAKLVLTFNLGTISNECNLNITLNQCENSLVVINSIVDVKSRVNLKIDGVVEENCSSEINCLINSGTRNVDANIDVNVLHKGSSSVNSIDVLGVLNSKSKCDFNGKIEVKENLSEIKSGMKSYFLCDDGAKVSSIPVLNIKSKNVSTSHSTIVLNIDDLKLEYLESKGMSNEEARDLLKHGALTGMVDRMASSFKKAGVRL